MQWWFKKICKGDEKLEDEEHNEHPSEGDSNQLRAIMEADPGPTIREVAQELNIDCSVVTWYLKQTEKVKKLNKWVPHKPTTNQKNHLKCHLLHNNEPFFDWVVMCNDFIQQLMTSSAAGWKRSSKALPKAKLAPKEGSQSLLGGLIHYSFLNPGETITSEKYAQQIDEMH